MEDDVQEEAAPQSVPKINEASDTLPQHTEPSDASSPKKPSPSSETQGEHTIADEFGVTEEEIPL